MLGRLFDPAWRILEANRGACCLAGVRGFQVPLRGSGIGNWLTSTPVGVEVSADVVCVGETEMFVQGFAFRNRGYGGVPAAFEASQESSFDFGCDVGIGLDDAVVEVMTEPAGLGDLRSAIGNKPCFVAMPQAMEREPRPRYCPVLSETQRTRIVVDCGA